MEQIKTEQLTKWVIGIFLLLLSFLMIFLLKDSFLNHFTYENHIIIKRIIFCFASGLIGLGLRAIYFVVLNKCWEDSYQKIIRDYASRLFIIGIGSILIFSILSISKFNITGFLFYTFAFSINTLLGFYSGGMTEEIAKKLERINFKILII